jgi:hypothetical protein
MSSLQYYVYPGVGKWLEENLGYSQAVRIGDRIEISGQGKRRAVHISGCEAEAHLTYRRLGH